TLTPDEFHVFRRTVGQNGASGFQSIQYRVLEFKLGLKYRTVIFEKPVEDGYQTVEFDVFSNARSDEDRRILENTLNQPSIYDAAGRPPISSLTIRCIRSFGMCATRCSARPNST